MNKLSETELYFFRPWGPNGYLSNFYLTSIEKDGHLFTSSEQLFMYCKCQRFEPKNLSLLNKIKNEHDPNKVKKLGRSIKNFTDREWDKIKYDIMVDCLRHKFKYNDDLTKKLISTKNMILYEASPWDAIWGIGFGKEEGPNVDRELYGQNLLGKALMQVRKELNS